MIKIIKDIFSYYNLKKKESNFRIGFFCENKYIYQYLKPYISKKLKNHKVLLLCFEELYLEKSENIYVINFYTNFFRQLAFSTIKLKYLYSSTPDLNNTVFRKSQFSKCKYIYLQHSPVSLTMAYNPKAFDAFDAVQVINTYQFNEMKEIKLNKNLNTKVFKSEYLFVKSKKKSLDKKNDIDLLVAPTWNSGFYKMNCHIILGNLLSKYGINYFLRPHPMSLKKNEITTDILKENKILYNLDSELNLKNYKFLISDWSGIFMEFALISKRKAFLINTPKKILNQNYNDYKKLPIEVEMRNVFAETYETNEIEKLVIELDKKIKLFNESSNFSDEDLMEHIKKVFYTKLI